MARKDARSGRPTAGRSPSRKLLALDIDDREALLRAMEDWCPPELRKLRAVLLQEHVGRVRDGLV